MTIQSDLNDAISAAHFALEEIDAFDLHSESPESVAEFDRLEKAHDAAVKRVIELAQTDMPAEKLRLAEDALRFYANRENYINGDDGDKYHDELEKMTGAKVCLQITDEAGKDGGERARNALAAIGLDR